MSKSLATQHKKPIVEKNSKESTTKIEFASQNKAIYPGLNPYSEVDSDYFFGRDKDIRKIITYLLAKPLTILHGESGVGKSSILQAGVISRINKEIKENLNYDGVPQFAIVIFNDWSQYNNFKFWLFLLKMDYLAGILIIPRYLSAKFKLLNKIKKEICEVNKKPIQLSKIDTKSGFIDQLNDWIKYLDQEGRSGNLFIILDQFEEYLRQTHNKNFEYTLINALNDPDLRFHVHFLISLISEEITLIDDRFKGRLRGRDDDPLSHRISLKHLNRESAEKAIEEPIKAFNEEQETNKTIEPDLVKAVLDVVKTRDKLDNDGKPLIEPVLLQLVMSQRWEEEIIKDGLDILREETFLNLYKGDDELEALIKLKENLTNKKLAKKEKSLKKIAKDHTYNKIETLKPEEQEIAASIFPYLVTSRGYKLSQTVSDLCERANQDRSSQELTPLEENQVRAVLSKLKDFRIVRPLAADRYEIFHDVFCDLILAWTNSFTKEQKNKLREEKARKEQILLEGKRNIINRLVESSDNEQQSEKAALLARQAYLFNQDLNVDMLNEVDRVLRKAVNNTYFSHILSDYNKEISSLAFNPNSNIVASSCIDGTVELLTLETQKRAISEKKQLPYPLKPRKKERDGGGVLSIAFSPKGEKLAVGCGDKKVRVWELNSPDFNKPLELIGHEDEVWAVAFSPDGKLLASGGWDNKVCLWDLENSENTLRDLHFNYVPIKFWLLLLEIDCIAGILFLRKYPICERNHPDWIWSVAFSPDRQTLAVGCRNGTVWLWELLPSEKLKLPKIPQNPKILSVHEEKNWRKLRKHDITALREKGEIFSVAFSPDGKLLATGSRDGKIRLWKLSQPYDADPIWIGDTGIAPRSLVFSQDGQWLASGNDDVEKGETGTVTLWKRVSVDPINFQEQALLKEHSQGVTSVAFIEDNQWLVSGSWDGKVRIWDLQPAITEPISLEAHQEAIITVAFSPNKDKKLLASGSYDNTTMIWEWSDLDRGLISRKDHKDHKKGNVNSVAFSPDGAILASGTQEGEVCLCNIHESDKIYLLSDKDDKQTINSVAFCPTEDKIILAAGSHSCKVLLWDISNIKQPKCLQTLEGHKDKVKTVAFSSDGKILASGDNQFILWLWWNLEREEVPPIKLPRFEGEISSIAFSPNKSFESSEKIKIQMLAVATNNERIELWDIRPLQKNLSAEPIFLRKYSSLKDLKGSCVAFSLDGLFFASGSYDGKVRLWDLQQPKANPIVLEGHTKAVKTLAFSPDGEWLAAGSEDGTIRFWIAKTRKIADMVCQKVWRNLTLQEWKDSVGENIHYESTCKDLPPGEGAPASEQTDTSSNGCNLQLLELLEGKLMPKQEKFLNDLRKCTNDREPDLSEEQIAKAFNKTKLDDAESRCLDALCRLGFVTKTYDELKNIKYSLTSGYRK